MSSWLTVNEAAERLGVKPATVYAYVSRGILHRRRNDDGHSRFDAAEVERLARRGRPRRTAGSAEVVIESAVTALGDDRPYYRGHDVLDLATWCELEGIAGLLWTGVLADQGRAESSGLEWNAATASHYAQTSGAPDTATAHHYAQTSAAPDTATANRHAQTNATAPNTSHHTQTSATPDTATANRHTQTSAGRDHIGGSVWLAVPHAVAAGRQAQAGLPPDLLPLERLQVIAPALATLDPLRLTPDPSAVVDIGKSLIAGMVDCLPDLGGPTAGPISARLWPKLTAAPPDPDLIDALRTALVLTADHELAASTLAVRVAASVRADPYAAVSAGLGVTGGALHGGASLGAEAMLAEAADASHAKYVMGQRLRRGERIPGFGHTVYANGDGRATVLLDRIRAAAPDHERLAVAEAMLVEARRRRLPQVNIDFALATLVKVSDMVTGAGEAIFAIARTAGWLAHAMEEYAKPTKLRLRAAYTGPTSGAS